MSADSKSTPPFPAHNDADLSLVILPQKIETHRFTIEVYPSWLQGRGVFGGLVMGALASAMETFLNDSERPLRSISGELCGPTVPGVAEIHLEMLRQGNAVSTIAARLLQGDGVQAYAVGVFGKTRITDRSWDENPPQPPTADSVPVFLPAVSFGPSFTSYFEYRPLGPMPFGGGAAAVAAGWVRPRRASRGLGPNELVATIDAWWPAAFAKETQGRPMATLSFACQVFADKTPLPAEQPLFYQAQARAARDGFVSELRELWDSAGHLRAINHQTFVFIR